MHRRKLLGLLAEGRTDAVNSVVGLSWSGGTTGERPPIKDLDALPFPAWDLVDVPRYRDAWREHHGYFSLNMVTTRGCPYHCNWCAKPIWGQRYAMRSPANVAEEISKKNKGASA